MTDTLIQRLREDLPKVNEPESQFSCVATPDIRQAADALEQQAAQIAEKDAEIARLKSALKRQEDREGRVGTHSPDCHKFGPSHYDCALRQIEALRADAARYAFIRARWTHCTFAWNKDSANSLKSIGLTIKTACPVKASSSSLDREIDAALRQEQPT